MVRVSLFLLASLPVALGGTIESLLNATSKIPALSNFSAFLKLNPTALSTLFPNVTGNITVLIPNDSALDNYFTLTGNSLTSLSAQNLSLILSYHTLVSQIDASKFLSPANGITVPTFLNAEQFNNRSAGPALQQQFGKNSNGQVLFFSPSSIPGTGGNKKRTILVRQSSNTPINYVRGGLAKDAAVSLVDGVWDGGNFQIVDTVLVPPQPCSSTIRPINLLHQLDLALNKTNLWDTLDHAPNVTCLAPSNDAFLAAGDPVTNLQTAQLQQALFFHTLPQPLYSNFLTNGQVINSLANMTVYVTVNNSGIWFNDAKVISPNVLTNNGLVHILDKVMSPMNASSTTSSNPSSTSSASATSSSAGAASALSSTNSMLTLFVSALAVFFSL